MTRRHEIGALPLPLAGEGWGEGASSSGHSRCGDNPRPALRADLSRKRERLQRLRGETASNNRQAVFTAPAIPAA
ncbi:hypothetical protein EHH60_12530 [Bradyrhizobium sp. RP6]|nr:hypothetical protein EHH60_12530 [Bradyrhizobium sp. RP6]